MSSILTLFMVCHIAVLASTEMSNSEMPSLKMTGSEILQKVDDNYLAENKRVVSTMIIHGRRTVRTLKAESFIQGTDKAFTEYLFPERDKGTKMLKLKDELWIFSPQTDRIVKIAGHLLRGSMMGSDVSYEDYMEDPSLAALYDVTVQGVENIQERECYVLELKAKKDDIAYHSRRLWIDSERFIILKENRYAKSGKLLKELTINNVMQIKERWYPQSMTFKDVLQSGDGTVFTIEAIEFDVTIPDHIFSKAALR